MPFKRENIEIKREVPVNVVGREVYYLLDAIRDVAIQMQDPDLDARAEDLLTDIGGWADKLRTISELAQAELMQALGAL